MTQQPSFMLSGQRLQAEAFTKFGIEIPDFNQISDEAARVIECLSKGCLPIIGEHCRDIVELHEAKIREGRESQTINELLPDEEYEALIAEQKRLAAQRNSERATAIACQASNEVLNKGAHILQKSAPLIAATSFIANRLRSFEEIAMPKLTKNIGNPPSLKQVLDGMPLLDEVGKFSIHEIVHNRVYDYRDCEKLISFLQSGIPDINARVGFSGSNQEDRKCTSMFVRLLAFVRCIKNVKQVLFTPSVDQENMTASLTEDVLTKLHDQLKEKNTKLNGEDLRIVCNMASILDNFDLRHTLCQSVQALCIKLDESEAIEERIRSKCTELNSMQKLLSTLDSFINIVRFQKTVLRPTNVAPLVTSSKASNANQYTLTELDYSDFKTENIEIEPFCNREALEYLSRLECSVDTGRLHSIQLSSCGSIVEAIVQELNNFKTLTTIKDLSRLTLHPL